MEDTEQKGCLSSPRTHTDADDGSRLPRSCEEHQLTGQPLHCAMKRAAFDGLAEHSAPPVGNGTVDRPATAAELRQSVSQIQAMLQMLDSSIGIASATSGWVDPSAFNPADTVPSSWSSSPADKSKPITPSAPTPAAADGADSDSDGSDDAPLMQQNSSRPPLSTPTAPPTQMPSSSSGTIPSLAPPADPAVAQSPIHLPTAGLVQQLPDLLVPLQAPNGAVLAQMNQAYSEFGMPSIESRYTAAMQSTQSLLDSLDTGIAHLGIPLPASVGPSGAQEPGPSPLNLVSHLLQKHTSLKGMRARNDHVRKRLRFGACVPQAERPATPAEPTATTISHTQYVVMNSHFVLLRNED